MIFKSIDGISLSFLDKIEGPHEVGAIYVSDVSWIYPHDFLCLTFSIMILNLKIKSVAYSSQGCHTGQLNFCNWQADGSTTG